MLDFYYLYYMIANYIALSGKILRGVGTTRKVGRLTGTEIG